MTTNDLLLKIGRLTESTRKVFLDCSLPNGAIVAAPSHKGYYPREAKDYFYVWPRDGAFVCLAARIIGLPQMIEPFFQWCMQAEGWKETGLFYKNYTVEGKKVRTEFQPDQNGMILIALHDHCYDQPQLIAKFHHLISHSADGLCQVWNKDHFFIITQDLWEERCTSPDLKDNFTYSLAFCIHGLRCAHQLVPNQQWLQTAEEMETVLQSLNNFSRTNLDPQPDASLLGLVWPANIISPQDSRIIKTINIIEQTFGKDFKIHRYDNDRYDGWVKDGIAQNKGAGYWPLLNFWMALYFLEAGNKNPNRSKRQGIFNVCSESKITASSVVLDPSQTNKEKAGKYYQQVLDNLSTDFIPEQIFDNKIQVSVSPLCWSHAMFILASRKLGLI